MDRIKAYTRTLQLMFLGIGLCTSLLLFALRYPILSLYDMSAETYHLAEQFILVLCFTGFGTAYEMPPSSDLSAAAEMPCSSFGMTLSTSG